MKQTQTMNNLTDFSVFLASKNQDGEIAKNASISTPHFFLNKDLNQSHI